MSVARGIRAIGRRSRTRYQESIRHWRIRFCAVYFLSSHLLNDFEFIEELRNLRRGHVRSYQRSLQTFRGLGCEARRQRTPATLWRKFLLGSSCRGCRSVLSTGRFADGVALLADAVLLVLSLVLRFHGGPRLSFPS